jgi:hypothetical protein
MTEKEKRIRDDQAARHTKDLKAQEHFKAGWDAHLEYALVGNPWAKLKAFTPPAHDKDLQARPMDRSE